MASPQGPSRIRDQMRQEDLFEGICAVGPVDHLVLKGPMVCAMLFTARKEARWCKRPSGSSTNSRLGHQQESQRSQGMFQARM